MVYYPSNQGVLGLGTDGAVVFDGTTTVLGLAPVVNVYTLTRDVHTTALTVNSGVTVKTANYRIFCQGTVSNSGTISNDGGSAVANAAGTAPSVSASFLSQRNGGAGGSGASGTGGAGTNGSFGTGGGAGGAGTSGAAGAAGTLTVTGANASANVVATPFAALAGLGAFGGNTPALGWGSGGGGGGSDSSSNAGGGGGSSGGVVAILASCLYNAGAISAVGGNGGNAAAGNAAGGGGGSGGAILIYTHKAVTGAGTTAVTGGTHGTGHGTGANGTDGGAGLLVTSVI